MSVKTLVSVVWPQLKCAYNIRASLGTWVASLDPWVASVHPWVVSLHHWVASLSMTIE